MSGFIKTLAFVATAAFASFLPAQAQQQKKGDDLGEKNRIAKQMFVSPDTLASEILGGTTEFHAAEAPLHSATKDSPSSTGLVGTIRTEKDYKNKGNNVHVEVFSRYEDMNHDGKLGPDEKVLEQVSITEDSKDGDLLNEISGEYQYWGTDKGWGSFHYQDKDWRDVGYELMNIDGGNPSTVAIKFLSQKVDVLEKVKENPAAAFAALKNAGTQYKK